MISNRLVYKSLAASESEKPRFNTEFHMPPSTAEYAAPNRYRKPKNLRNDYRLPKKLTFRLG
ncbi:hypothetical protein MCOR05_012009, partial [Pyricularia oryzae]